MQSRHVRNAATARRLTAPLSGVFLAALLVPAAANTAQWQRLYTAADRSVDIELPKTQRHGHVLLTWVRFSFVKVQHDPSARSYRSMLQQWAYECAAGRHALMQFREFSDPAGTGMLIAADSRDRYEWSYPVPDTLGAAALKVACAQHMANDGALLGLHASGRLAPGLNAELPRAQRF